MAPRRVGSRDPDLLSELSPKSTEFRPGRPEAAAIAWAWRSAAPAEEQRRARRRLRREGVIRALVGALVGALLYRYGGIGGLSGAALAGVAWVGSGVVLLAALTSPDRLYAGIGRGLALLGHGIGRLLAILLLTPVFFLFFLPFGRLLRGGRRDRLERRFDRAAPSYWRRRGDAPRTRASYEKAF